MCCSTMLYDQHGCTQPSQPMNYSVDMCTARRRRFVCVPHWYFRLLLSFLHFKGNIPAFGMIISTFFTFVSYHSDHHVTLYWIVSCIVSFDNALWIKEMTNMRVLSLPETQEYEPSKYPFMEQDIAASKSSFGMLIVQLCLPEHFWSEWYRTFTVHWV
jgi:hypothetical protein